MKNFKKLLVTLLALVLLVCGAVVVSLAAATPAEVIADARVLLAQAMDEDGYIATRSEKMRELDRLIDANMVNLKNSQEWREFQVEYRTAQSQLREDCVAEAGAALDSLLDKDLSAKDAQATYAGLATLVSPSGDARGYFDTESAEYLALANRLKGAQAIAKLQEAEDAGLSMDKGALLLWVHNYVDTTLDTDESVLGTAEYLAIDGWFEEIYASVKDELYEAVRVRTAEAIASTTSYARAMELVDEIEKYFTGCYFNTGDEDYYPLRTYSYFAEAYAYLNEIERNAVLLKRGAYLKSLAEYVAATPMDAYSEQYADFSARFEALRDTEDPDSLLSTLYAKANGYKQQVAAVFTEGYTGAIDTEAELAEIYDQLATLVETCYFPSSSYVNDLAIVDTYIEIFAFYQAFVGLSTEDATEAQKIARNALYKEAVSAYNRNSSAIVAGEPSYSQAFITVYTDLITRASKEINALLNSWLKPAKECTLVNPDDESYVYSLEQIVECYNKLNTYYVTKSTALYYGAAEDKAMTADIQASMKKVETRLIKDIKDTLAAIGEIVVIPGDLATIDPAGLKARIEAQNELVAVVGNFVYIYADADEVALAYHQIAVGRMLSMLCEIEVEYAKDTPDSDFLASKYNELKAFMASSAGTILPEEEDYVAFLLLKNKTDVKMGEAFVPGAREYLDKLEAVVDEDNFDKVYALMHLDEYIRQNGITRPDASDTTSLSALFYQEYDVLAKKVHDFRAAKAAEREAGVSLGDYSASAGSFYDMEKSSLSATKYSHAFYTNDRREYGVNGSPAYITFEYIKGVSTDGFVSVTAASSTDNFILEMYITTFDSWPTSGVSFNSAYRTGLPSAIWPWLGAITGSGQLQVPDGPGKKKIVTDREGGYIVPGQWTHIIMEYKADEKLVSYYINDEKIVDADGNDAWSCALSKHYDLNEAIRIGHSQSGGGSFSLDNVRTYVGDQPRNVNLLNDMSAPEKFAFYTNIANNYITNGVGLVTDAKTAVEFIREQLPRYWGIPGAGSGDSGNSGDGGLGGGDSGDSGDSGGNAGSTVTPDVSLEAQYLFDETTYWDTTAIGYVDPGITYAELKAAVDTCRALLEIADAQLEGAMKDSVLAKLRTDIATLEALAGISNLTARKNLLTSIDNYIVENTSYIASFEGAMLSEYNSLMARREKVVSEIDAYARVDEYIKMVDKLVAAKDLYSRTVYRSQAKGLMDLMERDHNNNTINLDALKAGIPEFVTAIDTFNAQSALLDDALLRDNNAIIVDCMSRFPALAEDAIKDYDRLNKYIVLVRRILLEGSYDPGDLSVQEALVVYNKMNDLFYDALQREHAASLQSLIDTFNNETSYITRLGIFKAVQAYLEENAAVIDNDHEAIKTILSQYEQMNEKFGTEEGREQEWAAYGETLKINAGKFSTLVTEMRLCDSYAELGALRERAASLFYYMDSTDAEAKLAIEYYLACEALLAQKALRGDIFIEASYTLSKATSMKDMYAALIVASEAFAGVDVTYNGMLSFTEKVDSTTYTVDYTMEQAVSQYMAILASYNSFVTVINGEVDTALDVVCSVRASFAINQPVVALFKKIYD